MANRASKGSAFEREICRRLSLWWTKNDGTPRDDVFWRTSNSGGRATVNKSRIHCGDICAIDPIGQPLIDVVSWEIKRGYPKATIHDLLDSPAPHRTTYGEWIRKAEKVRKQAGAKAWAIIHKRDRRTPMLIAPAMGPYGFRYWHKNLFVPCVEIDFSPKEILLVQIAPLSDFLNWIQADDFDAS